MTDLNHPTPRQTSDWPTKAAPSEPVNGDDVVLTRQLERELRLSRQKRMPVVVSLGIGISLAVLAYVAFAMQQGSFAGAGAAVDARLSTAQDKSIAAGQKAASATGDAARNAGANIDEAIDRATNERSEADQTDTPPAKN
jgi:hypothetical protein